MIDSTRKRKKSNTSLWIMLVAIVAILVALFLLPSCGGSGSAAATTRVEVGAPAPDFTVAMLDGTRVTLADLRGKVVLLTFWTTWCPHCRTEMERIANEVVPCFADRNFVLLPVSRGESREAVARSRFSDAMPRNMCRAVSWWRRMAAWPPRWWDTCPRSSTAWCRRSRTNATN